MKRRITIIAALCALTASQAQDVSTTPVVVAPPPVMRPANPDFVRAVPVPGTMDCAADYPPGLTASHAAGWSEVAVDVAENGRAGQPMLERSSGNLHVDVIAINCMLHWRFTPQMDRGRPIASHNVFVIGIAPPGESPPREGAPVMVSPIAVPAPPGAMTAMEDAPVPVSPVPVPAPPGGMPGFTQARPLGRTHDCSSYYPSLSAHLFESGLVLVGYDVGADGSIGNVSVVKSSSVPRLDAAALACVREKWRDTPALQGDRPVASPGQKANILFKVDLPGDADDFVERGTARESIGDHAGAIADFTTAIGLDPKNAAAYKARAASYAAQGDHARAAADLRKAEELH